MEKIKPIFLLLMICFSCQGFAQLQLGEKISIPDMYFSYAASVSTSQDGSRTAVGGYGKSEFGFRVYEFDGSTWDQVGNDLTTQYPNDISAYQVSLSADGNRIAVGAVINSSISLDFGYAKVYEYDGENWIQLGDTINGEINGDFFGLVISLSAAGNRLAVGAKFNNNSAGHARAYEYDGTNWVQLGEDIDGDASGDYFGTSLSMSSDGNRVAVGANQYLPGGLVRVFEFDGANWMQVGDDLTGQYTYDSFGVSSSLSHDGNRIIVGDYQNLGYAGYIKVFDFDGVSWVQVGDEITGLTIRDRFGRMVSISDDGNRIGIGAPSVNDNSNNNQPGYVEVYELNNGNWNQRGITLIGDEVRDEFGQWLAISGDGSTLVTGSLTFIYKQSGTEDGYAKVYDLNTILDTPDLSIVDTILIYPNPSSDYIRFTKSDLVSKIILYNSIGQKTKLDRDSSNKIDVSGLSNGLYVVQFITNQNQIFNQKFLKK